MKKKKKLKRKAKRFIIAIITIVVIFLIILLIPKSKSNLSPFVKTTKNTILYDSNLKENGTIKKDITIEIETNIYKKDYLKIKNSDYYINKNDIKNSKNDYKDLNKHYIVLDKNIEITKKTSLLKDGKEAMTINNLNVPIQYMDYEYYYIKYMNNLFSIKKDESIKEIDNKNSDKKNTDKISTLYYFEIKDECNNYNCTKTEDAEQQINKIKELGYYSISTYELILYTAGFLKLEDNAICLTTTTESDITKNISSKTGLLINAINDSTQFISTNKPVVVGTNYHRVDRYQVKSYTTIDNIQKMASGQEVIETAPAPEKVQEIAVLNYHFFYDPSQGEECNEVICLDTKKFREHLKYLKDNGYKTLTMHEFVEWIYGEIELPEKSVLITIDDGAMGTGKHNGNKLNPLLEEYDENATLFLIAGWWGLENYIGPKLDIQSHTFNMHNRKSGVPELVGANYQEAYNDIKQSIDIIGNNDSFCYPFYSYDDEAIQAIKDLGFRVAFVGGNRKATRNSNKYLIPRYPIQSDIQLNDFIEMVS